MASEIYDMESCVRFWMAGSGWGRCPGRAAVGKVRGQELPSRPTCDGVGTGIREHEPVPVAQLGQQNVLVDAVGAVTGRAPHLRRQAGGFRGRGKCVCVWGNADSVAAGARNTSPTERRGHKGGGGTCERRSPRRPRPCSTHACDETRHHGGNNAGMMPPSPSHRGREDLGLRLVDGRQYGRAHDLRDSGRGSQWERELIADRGRSGHFYRLRYSP